MSIKAKLEFWTKKFYANSSSDGFNTGYLISTFGYLELNLQIHGNRIIISSTNPKKINILKWIYKLSCDDYIFATHYTFRESLCEYRNRDDNNMSRYTIRYELDTDRP